MLTELVVVAKLEEKYSEFTVWDGLKELVGEQVNRPGPALDSTHW